MVTKQISKNELEVTYDADDEFPNCMNCDNINASQEVCDFCGSAWKCYHRTVIEGIDSYE